VDPFEDARLPRPLRFLAWTFPIGRVFGIPVRMYATSALTFVAALAYVVHTWGAGDKGPPWTASLAYAAIAWVGLYVIVLAHELGHALTARRWWHVPCEKITLSIFGGVAHLSHAAPSPKAEAVIALAGPATHGLWLAALWPLRTMIVPGLDPIEGWPIHPLAHATRVLWDLNLALAAFNLLPFFPLDGGRVFRSLLAMKWHPNRATRLAAQVGLVGAAGLGLYSLLFGGLWGMVGVGIAIAMAVQCRNEMMAARHADGPYGARREAWESDPDAWKRR